MPSYFSKIAWLILATGLTIIGLGCCSAPAQILERLPGTPPYVSPYRYMLVKAEGFTAAHVVETERPWGTRTQQVSIVNLQLPLQRAPVGLFTLAPELVASSTMLMTLVVLPNETTGLAQWQPIKPDTIAPSRRVTAAVFADTCFRRLARYHRTGGRFSEDNAITRSADIKPIIYRDGRYWTPASYTLTEVFLICPVPFILPQEADNVTISIEAKPFPFAQFEQEWKLGQRFYTNGRHPDVAQVLASKLFLEKQLADGTYEFYTAGTNIMDGGSYYTGADNFRYKPGIGLVSGKYSTHLNLGSQDVRNTFFTTKRITVIK
jgi:hypothetical protein